MRFLFLIAVGLFSADPTVARPVAPVQEPVITVAGTPYYSWQEYTSSAYFQRFGKRCGGPVRNLLQGAPEGPGDCGYNSTNPLSKYSPTLTYKIPVVVHVIQRTNGTGFINAAKVQSQIDILNEDFLAIAGTNGGQGSDAKIQFELASIDPGGNPTTGITYSTNNTWFNDGGAYWNTLAWNPNKYLNIYTNNAGGNLGYVPNIPQGGIAGSSSDRVVILWSSFGLNGPIGPPFNKGRTTTHEVGHYLGLYHTFDGGCGSVTACYTSGDLICDTNRESSPTYGCPGAKATCGSLDPSDNYMDYTNDLCMFRFTPEQVKRMRCTLEEWRPSLYTVSGGGPLPTVVSLNIDVGSNSTFPKPSSSFAAAAGQSGVWNTVSGAAGGAGALVDVTGSASGASVSIAGGNGNFEFNNTATTGEAQNLLDDLQDAGNSTWTFSGLPNGSYDVFAYSWAPDNPLFLSSLTIFGGSKGAQICGGQAWSGSFVEGVHYVTDRVTIAGGSLSIQVAQVGSDPSSLNGIQLVSSVGGSEPGMPVCFGNGSGAACPCGNVGGNGEGCANSTGVGAILSASGTASVSADDLVLEVQQGPAGKVGIFLQGTMTVSVPFADGILCAGNPIKRLEAIFLDASGNGASGGSVVALGNVGPGQVRAYQFWFRDAQGPCSTGSNLSNGYEVLWQ